MIYNKIITLLMSSLRFNHSKLFEFYNISTDKNLNFGVNH
jgi:hypothetical protein